MSGSPKLKPAVLELRGRDTLPGEERLLAHLPEHRLQCLCGCGKIAGRCSAPPSAFDENRIGDDAGCDHVDRAFECLLEGEEVGGDVSSSETQLHHWRPLPTRPPVRA